MNKMYALLYASACIFAWSFIPVVSKVTTSDLSPLQFLLWSNILSAAVMGGLGRRQLCATPRMAWCSALRITMVPAFLGCFFYYLCLYYAYAHANGISVLVVQYSWPILMVLLAPWILKEKLTKTSILAVILGFMGVVSVISKGNLANIQWENSLVLLVVMFGATAFALFSLLSKKITFQAELSVFLFFSWASVFSFFAVLISDQFSLPATLYSWMALIINGIIINGISYFWWLRALQLEVASRIAPLVFLTPILAALWLVLFFGEAFYISYAVGLLLCISAGILTVLPSKRS